MTDRQRLQVATMILAVCLACLPAAAGPQDAWVDEANARIEAIRKRDVAVLVVDGSGTPVPGAAVSAAQTGHRFAFGSVVNGNLVNNSIYSDFFFDHFEWAVFENQSKWIYNEPIRDHENWSLTEQMYSILEARGVPVRGHCIFWANETYVPGWARDLPDNELQDEIDERIDSAVTRFRNRFVHWDVNNEMLSNHFFENHLGPSIRPYMFQQANLFDPDALLFVNDYSIIAGSSARTDAYIQQIQWLQSQGAPVGGIGVQGHFWGSTVSPTAVLARLDQLAVLNLPVWVTEYDVVNADDQLRADNLENAYRAAFSHPAVEGILMWGFWAGSHWRGPDAAIVDEDWTLNAAGVRYEALMAEWTTAAAGNTGGDGQYPYRGFHGTYDITVNAGDPLQITVDLPPGPDPAEYMVSLVPGSCFTAGEVRELTLQHDPASGLTTLTWRPLPYRTDMPMVYDTLRSPDPDNFNIAATCVESADGSDRIATDPDIPTTGSAFYYLIRGSHDCPGGEGGLGQRSDGGERVGRVCL